MPNNSGYDVIIAGAGPAGSTAGYLLAGAGLRVLIIDRRTFPREKLCAGLITHKTVLLMERVYGESPSSLREQGIINYTSGRYEIYCREKPLFAKDMEIPFHFIDRDTFDSHLLDRARTAGANVLEGDGVKSLNMLGSTVTTRSGKRVSASLILGADGVNSRVRRSFPVDLFGRNEWSQLLASAHEVMVSRERLHQQISHPRIAFGFVDCGYAWIFPNRDRVKIGMCSLNSRGRKDLLPAFRAFLRSLDRDGFSTEQVRSSVLPYGCFLPDPAFRNVLLLGDAAGLADPLLGEGIFYAQRSAELAALAILAQREHLPSAAATQQVREHYLALLGKYVFPELIYAEKIRTFLFSRLSRFGYLPLKILMNVFGDMPEETVHGLRSFRWMKKVSAG
ncbi:MAG: geranylgeranyl reductase family protein [Nitrospiraceae bacterium]|nr:MAG: geranylgeranyl reductase family protein [Nitrospiraceae bacterium]